MDELTWDLNKNERISLPATFEVKVIMLATIRYTVIGFLALTL